MKPGSMQIVSGRNRFTFGYRGTSSGEGLTTQKAAAGIQACCPFYTKKSPSFSVSAERRQASYHLLWLRAAHAP